MRFRLRNLLLFVLVACALSAWFTTVVFRPHHFAAKRMERLAAMKVEYEAKPRGSLLLRRVFGDSLFQRVTSVRRGQSTDGGLMNLLRKCEHLERLDLAHSRDLSADDFAAIGELRNLTHLSLVRSNVADHDLIHIAKLCKLESLTLYCTDISDDSMPSIAKLKKLRSLDLNGTSVSDNGLKLLGSLTQLATLHVRGTQITDDGLAAVSSLPSLRNVALCMPIRGISFISHHTGDPFPNTTRVSAEFVAKLRENRPELKIRY